MTEEYLLLPSNSRGFSDANALRASPCLFLPRYLTVSKTGSAERTIPLSLGSFFWRLRLSGAAGPPLCGGFSGSPTMSAALRPEAPGLSDDAEGPSAHEGAGEPHQPGRRPPKVLFVIGPTGVGKSRLSLDVCLALRERGIPAEIISADSMQVGESLRPQGLTLKP